jgi:hypothetical protein
VGFIIVSRGKIPGKTCEKRINNDDDDNDDDDDDNNNNNNNNNAGERSLHSRNS